MVVSVGVEGLWAWVWEEAPEEFWTVPSDLALGSVVSLIGLNPKRAYTKGDLPSLLLPVPLFL